MTDDAESFTLTSSRLAPSIDPRTPDVAACLREMGCLVLQDGKAFHQYEPIWEERPTYLVATHALARRPSLVQRARFFALSHRGVSSSTNERTSIFCLLPPGVVTGHNNPVDGAPDRHPTASALTLMAEMNSFTPDYLLRLLSNVYVSKFILDRVPVPPVQRPATLALVHLSLRLMCGHCGHAPLWREQFGEAWREQKSPFAWPVLKGDDERWAVRAAIDAVVADAYGLSREQYAYVLSTFSHKSYPKAPELCLARFDDLKSIGLEAFTRTHDPYWDISLNENLPQPVIDLPIPNESPAHRAAGKFDFEETGNADFVPAVESAGLLIAAERQPPYETRKTRKMKGKKGG